MRSINTNPKKLIRIKKITKYSLIIIISLLVIFTVLRMTHILLKIGNNYYLCTEKHLALYASDNVSNKDIEQIKYLKSLEIIHLENTDIKDLSFLSELLKLNMITVNNSYIKKIDNFPNLEKLKKIKYISLGNIEVYNCDIFENLYSLESLEIINTSPTLTNIDGLINLKDIGFLRLRVNLSECKDISAVMQLPNLRFLSLQKGVLTEEQIRILEEKGVDIVEV
jgi:hypothetical protein